LAFDRLRRRDFVALFGSTAVGWPLAARAQQAAGMRRVGMLMDTAQDNAEGQARVAAFRQELKQRGWVEGRNIQIDLRWSGGNVEREFPDGKVVLLTRLCERQNATVLTLPIQPKTATEAEAQQRVNGIANVLGSELPRCGGLLR
jgi:hypothetical protein